MRPSKSVMRICPRSNATKAIGKRVKNTINSSLISSVPGTDRRKNFVPMISVKFIIIKIAILTAARIANQLVIFVTMAKAFSTQFLIHDLFCALLAPSAYRAGLPLKSKRWPALYTRSSLTPHCRTYAQNTYFPRLNISVTIPSTYPTSSHPSTYLPPSRPFQRRQPYRYSSNCL